MVERPISGVKKEKKKKPKAEHIFRVREGKRRRERGVGGKKRCLADSGLVAQKGKEENRAARAFVHVEGKGGGKKRRRSRSRLRGGDATSVQDEGKKKK